MTPVDEQIKDDWIDSVLINRCPQELHGVSVRRPVLHERRRPVHQDVGYSSQHHEESSLRICTARLDQFVAKVFRLIAPPEWCGTPAIVTGDGYFRGDVIESHLC